MSLIELPKRLHRYVKCAGAHDAEALAFLDERAQLGRGSHQCARGVEARDFAFRPVQAEDPLVARDLGTHLQDGAPAERRIGVPQRHLRDCIEHLALPVEHLRRRRGGADRRDHQRQSRSGCNDADGAAARQTAGADGRPA
jgi:hypothetical protein